MSPGAPPWQGRSIASSKLRMLEFSAFLEQPQDSETVSSAAFISLWPYGEYLRKKGTKINFKTELSNILM